MKEIDPVEELHKIRRAICKEVGGTPAAYAQYYYEMSQARLAADKTAPKVGKARTKSKATATVHKSGQHRKVVMAWHNAFGIRTPGKWDSNWLRDAGIFATWDTAS